MLKNYIITSIRNLVRNKFYSLLNIAGLAIGVACCLFIILYVRDELSYDRFHEKADRIYRVVPTFATSERVMKAPTNAHVQGPMIGRDFPEVENYVRFTGYEYASRVIMKYGDRFFTEDHLIYADSSFFNVFSFEMIKGNPNTALVNPHSVVITEEMADKYFGTGEPLGKTLVMNNRYSYAVTGVITNIPDQSHVKPDFILSFSTLNLQPTGNTANELLSNNSYFTFILLREGVNYKRLEAKLNTYFNKYVGDVLERLGGYAKLELEPLERIYLYSDREEDIEGLSDISYIYLFSGIGIFIMLLACLNFMNLSTARSANRAKEVGLRKVAGAQRLQLIRQFIGESVLLIFISVITAVMIVLTLLPVFRNVSGKEISLDFIFNPVLLGVIAGFIFILGILGGSYPALFLSSFRPVEVLRGTINRGVRSSVLRIILVSFQFMVSIVLIIGTLVVNNQLHYVKNKNLGYDKEHIVYFPMRNPETRENYELLKIEFLKHPQVIEVSASRSLPLGNSSSGVHHPFDRPEEDVVMFYGQSVDEDFLDTYGIELIAGRSFSKEFPGDKRDAAILNKTAVKVLGWEDNPIGKEIERFESLEKKVKYRVVGVVKDYHFWSLHDEIRPLILYNGLGDYEMMSVRLSPRNINETIKFLRDTWSDIDPFYPFEFSFFDEHYNSLYRTEERLGNLFGYFTVLAVIIGCLGLFGLASYMAEQRTKEIGVRKVLGASVGGIVMLLVKEFTKWIIIAVLIAWPLGYYIMHAWLENFAYRTELGISVFLFSAFLALFIAVITVSFQAVKAAYTNPVQVMKYE